MRNANLALGGDGQGAYASGYVWEGNHFQLVPHQPQFAAAYGSLNASADDFTSALRAYLGDWQTDSGRFLSRDWLLRSETPHTYLAAKAGLTGTYAYGNEGYELEGRQFRGHRGAIGGFLSAFLYNRKDGVGYSFCINTHNESFYRFADARIRAFLTKTLSKVETKMTYPVSEAATKPFVGYYRLNNPGQLYTGFLERLQNTFRLDTADGGIRVGLLLGPVMQWQQTDSKRLLLKNAWMKWPHVALTFDEGGAPVVLDGGLFFEKISVYEAWLSLIALIASFLLLMSSVVFGLISSILYFKRKWPLPLLILRLMPTLCTICFLLILSSGMQLLELMRTASPTENAFAIWNMGKWAYLLTGLSFIVLLAAKWKWLCSHVLKAYLSVLALGILYFGVVFIVNNWY